MFAKQAILLMVAGIISTLVIATPIYGVLLGLIYGDYRILVATGENPLLPALQLWRYSSNPVLLKIAGGSLCIASTLVGFMFWALLRVKKEPLGNAAFQNQAELQNAGWFRKDGHVFGRFGNKLLRVRDDGHYVIIGPTRSGKGVGFVIPNALMHVGSMLVTDLKGEIWKATAGHRKQQGNKVFRFAPGQEDTHHYNPLDFIRPEIGNRTTDIQNIASILIPDKGGDNAVWQGMAQQVAAGLISYVLESDHYHRRRHLGEVNSLLNCGVNLQDLMKEIIKSEPGLSRFTVESFNFYIALSEKTAASAITDLQNALKPWKNERIVAATEYTDIDLNLNLNPISIYLTPNVNDVVLLRPLLTLFVQQLMNLMTLEHNAKSLPVLFLLDEFRQLKKMDDVMQKLPFVAGYNMKFVFIIQDLKNLDEIYGETARYSMLGNCRYQLVLGANDQATAEFVSRALGKQTVRYKTKSYSDAFMRGASKTTWNETIRERDLMMPQEVRQLDPNRFVLLIEGQKPIYGRKLKFFEMEPFKSAEAYSMLNVPSVPRIEYRPQKPVPALTDAYGAANRTQPAEVQATSTAPAVPAVQKVEETTASAVPHAEAPDPFPGDLFESQEETKKRLEEKTKALEQAVSIAAKRVPRKARPSIEDLFKATVPDPEIKPGTAAA